MAVIGGGITGVTTAYTLAQRDFRVTLFEKNRYAAMETSFANGGQLPASNAEVWNHSSTILKGLKWMLKSDGPLLVNPKPSWHKLSWFVEFISNIPHYERNTIESARLAIAAREHLFAWAQAEGVDFDLKKKGIRPLIAWLNECFPGINTRQVVPWAGLRPLMPNMMPRVGPGKAANVFYNTGHGHLGWTLSAVTADMVGRLVKRALGGNAA